MPADDFLTTAHAISQVPVVPPEHPRARRYRGLAMMAKCVEARKLVVKANVLAWGAEPRCATADALIEGAADTLRLAADELAARGRGLLKGLEKTE